MTAIDKYFFTPLYCPRTAWDVFRWWERRRLLFNVCVGGAGLLTLASLQLLAALPPHLPFFDIPWPAVVVYGVLANLFYTLGAPADLLIRNWFGPRAAAAEPVLFRYGFVFSLGLTLLPIALGAMLWGLRLLVG
jgi:hypothetical protein